MYKYDDGDDVEIIIIVLIYVFSILKRPVDCNINRTFKEPSRLAQIDYIT
jgi:hypothetical protein